MLDSIDRWMFRKYVAGAARLPSAKLRGLHIRWKEQVGLMRYVRLLPPLWFACMLCLYLAVGTPDYFTTIGVVGTLVIPLAFGMMELRMKKAFVALWMDTTYCRHCGYDLPGTIAAGLTECPECGHPVHKAAYSE